MTANHEGTERPAGGQPEGTEPGGTHFPPPGTPVPRGPRLRVLAAGAVAIAALLWLGAMLGGPVSRLLHEHREGAGGGEGTAGSQYYTCGMHPWVILPRPGDCPVCAMKLVPLDPSKFTGEVTINPVVAQNIGVRVAPVVSGPVVRTTHTVGTIAYDETKLSDLNVKVGGWIEKMDVDYLGAPVRKGDPVFELYSPDLYMAQQEFLVAWRNFEKFGQDATGPGAQSARDLLDSATTKLEYFDVSTEQVEEIKKRGTPAKTMSILSPEDGVVIEKHAFEGMKVDPGMQVYRIADLSKVWVMVTLYEYQLPYVQLGQAATMRLSYLPGQEFSGRVIYIYPYLSEKTRQIEVRLEFENPAGLLKPGMYATVELHSTLARDRTLAPRSSVIDTGERRVAFVSLGDGRFEPRRVQTGVEAENGMIEILDGLKPGELVVVSGQFLIDSEANVREALARMIRGELSVDHGPTVATTGTPELRSLPEAIGSSLSALLVDYLAIGHRLAADSADGLSGPAGRIAAQVDTLLRSPVPGDDTFWHRHQEAASVRGEALELAAAKTIEEARRAFADLSVALDTLVRATGVPPGQGHGIQELHCPMYRESQGGMIWLQAAGPVENPYFGTSMPGCFDRRATLPVTGAAPPSTDGTPAGTGTGGTSKPEPGALPSPAEQDVLDDLARAYLDAHRLLAADRFDGVPALLHQVHDAAARLSRSGNASLAAATKAVAEAGHEEATSIEDARLAYKALSPPLIALLRGYPPGKGIGVLVHVKCPMTKGDWLQAGEAIENPYYGSKMLTCGEVVERIGGGTR